MKNKVTNWLEIAKYNLIIGHGWEEAYAYGKLNEEERAEFDEYKRVFLEDALKDCLF